MEFRTIPEMFLRVTDKFGDSKPAFRYKLKGAQAYTDLTFKELREKVECFGLGLLNLGLRPGDRIGIIAENRIEWVIADLAITGIGAVDVPIFPILTAKQAEFIYGDCAVSGIIVSNDFQLSKVLQFKENVSSLRHVIVMNPDFNSDDVAVKSMDYIISRGNEIRPSQERRRIFEDHCMKVREEDLLTLIYTSGTTGNPKGVMLTHKNVVANIKGSAFTIGFSEKDSCLSYLPLCHSYERTTGYYCMFSVGATINFAESIETISSNLLETAPTIMTTVPKLLETIKKRIYSAIEKEPIHKRKIFHWAFKVGTELVRRRTAGEDPLGLKIQHAMADKLVFHKIREKLGGRMELLASGGAPLPNDVYEFFLASGINILQGYGLTEASPVVSVAGSGDQEVGTIGKPLNNVEVRLAEDGEILVRGDNVMKGYWNDPEATRLAIDEEGWLYTGDVGIWTEKGNIRITDRKKNIFVSSGGKNIAPQPIESLLAQSKYIEHVVLIGDNREFCTALISPDFDKIQELATEFGITFNDPSELIINDKIMSHIKKDIDYLQKDISKFEKVRKFRMIAKPFSIENGELSPKMSIKRHVVEKKYAELINNMYDV
jgi:long-chain acyl-CoA synthetase